ncbi:MAG: UDP-N-acetylglucosamine 2-epimerase [Elusimicrobiota bacterium]|jgi:UDP-N-acetylglucosamine 2-epimerase (non-hydrolysing)/GDP/UDP-N,N'-diacetylbacillosamine 2-epimerase (hydrolysing)
MRKRRRIAVVTSSRADYGLLHWLIKAGEDDPAVDLRLVVTGSHLSSAFGRTARLIRADGHRIAASVSLGRGGGTDLDTARSLGAGVTRLAESFSCIRPDLVVLLGDRFETLAAASAATTLRIPIGHLHGGEASEGVIDEQIRHAVTKLSYLHFTAAEPYRRRVLQLGEDPKRVFNVGAPGLEYISRMRPLAQADLERLVGMDLTGPFLLATFHPEGGGATMASLQELLAALSSLNLPTTFTYANADAEGRAVNESLERFCRTHPRCRAVPSLGQDGYLSLMRRAQAVVGNSSSGILEAPTLRIPTVNIGERQAGRLRAPSVIDTPASRTAILKALRQALSFAFRQRHCRGVNPYGGGPVSARILRILKTFPLPAGGICKPFHDWHGGRH